MSRRMRISLLVVGFVVTVGFCPLIAPGWGRTVGLDYGPLTGLKRTPAASPGTKWTQIADAQDIEQERFVKDALVADLVAGRLTLAQVTDDFMLMAQRQPGRLAAIRCFFAGETDRERVARSVINYTQHWIGSDRSEEVVGRLEGELQAMLHPSIPNTTRPVHVIAEEAAKGNRPMGPPPPGVRSLP